MLIKEIKILDLKAYENNPRNNENAVDVVANSIKEFGFKVPIVIDENNVIVAGHTRLKAAEKLGLDKVPCIVADDLTPEQIKAFRLADNKTAEFAEWDFEKLETEISALNDLDFDMQQFGFDEMELDSNSDRIELKEAGLLIDKFIVPPFSVLDTRQGYWQERKKMWNEKIQDQGDRGDAKLFPDHISKYGNLGKLKNISILDPVLCEIVVKWFLPKSGGKAFDCFAGDTAFGFVSATLGAEFTGIELREKQVVFNTEQVERCSLSAKYICDDGRNVDQHIEAETQDLFFSCPPYYDLEVYSDKPNDASNQETYEEFYNILDTAFKKAEKCLKNNRFAVIVAGDVRNKKTGAYYGFVDDIKATFQRNGMILYNEMILVNMVGSSALRASKAMTSRKVVKTHQNVLVFYKGDTKDIPNEFEKIEYKEGVFFESEDEQL